MPLYWVYADTPTTAFGDSLKEQVEERLNFFETGAVPRKNIDVMKEAVLQAAAAETTAMYVYYTVWPLCPQGCPWVLSEWGFGSLHFQSFSQPLTLVTTTTTTTTTTT